MALVTAEDLAAPAVSDPTRRVVDLMPARLRSERAPMPPAPSRPLTAGEMATLMALADAPVPAGDGGCDMSMRTPKPRSVDDGEIDQCYRFQAHDRPQPGDTTPFSAPPGEYYGCFFFDIPWPEGSQAIAFRSLDTSLTHHWALSDTVAEHAPGDIVRDAPNCGLGAERLLAVYGLNQQRETHMPSNVGLELPAPGSGRGLLLGVHFFNSGEPTTDT